jgi:hypothetical protein
MKGENMHQGQFFNSWKSTLFHNQCKIHYLQVAIILGHYQILEPRTNLERKDSLYSHRSLEETLFLFFYCLGSHP